MRRWLWAGCAVLLVGCKSRSSEPPHAQDKPAALSRALVDLLQNTPALVVVSSRVDNPRDLPEHLVDGREDTAWNGATGEARGWIDFYVPEDANVAYVELSAGFNKKTARDDLFLANQRVAEVRVECKLKAPVNVALDPNVRTPQRVEIPLGAHSCRLWLTKVVAGTNPSWCEIALSELRVIGTPGAMVRATPGPPLVGVGDDVPWGGSFVQAIEVSRSAACARFVRDAKRHSEEPSECDGDDDLESDSEAGTLSLVRVSASNGVNPTSFGESSSGEFLGVRTPRGFFLTDILMDGNESYAQGAVRCSFDFLKGEVLDTKTGPAVAVQIAQHVTATNDGLPEPGDEMAEWTAHVSVVCRVTHGSGNAESLLCATKQARVNAAHLAALSGGVGRRFRA